MIIIKSNIKTLQKNYQTRIKKIEKAGIKSQKQAAQYMVLQARLMAPKRSGRLWRGIRSQHSRKYSRVISTVAASMPYNMWVNESSPYKRIRLIPHFRPKGMKKRIMFYYRDVAKTGVPQFFDIAAELTSQKFPKIVLDNVRKALIATATTGGSLK